MVWGRGDFDARRVIPDIQKIIDAEAAIFGGLPYHDRYLFILHVNDKGRGGLEHRRSCALLVPRFSFVQRSAYEDFLLLVAHEFFHCCRVAWWVPSVRPLVVEVGVVARPRTLVHSLIASPKFL